MRYERELPYNLAATAIPDDRALFIRRTYTHLAGAILAFMALEAFLIQTVSFNQIMSVLGESMWGPLLVMGAFMGASWLARTWARSPSSPAIQYLGLGLYVVVQALVILPLLVVTYYTLGKDEGTRMIGAAGIMTLALFGGLTLTAFVTRKDFSFLAPVLIVASFIAMGAIIAGIVFQFTLGLFFSFAMVALMAGFILYQSSQVLLYYRTDQYVAAALELFASIATLFFYVLRILLILNRRN